MPNYIKNKIELIGEQSDIDSLIQEFSTFYPSVPHRSFDGNITYKKGDTYGWLNESTGEFTMRGEEPCFLIPDGFVQHFEEEWTRFPDFNKIITMPESLGIESGSLTMALENQYSNPSVKEWLKEVTESINRHDAKEERIKTVLTAVENCIRYGHATWYSWSIENWGTKWNSSECETLGNNTFTFSTAWSGVPELMQIISEKHPNVTIKYSFADEDSGCNVGVGVYSKDINSFGMLKNSSKEAFDIYFDLHPDRRENYKLSDGTYTYIDED